MNKIKTTEPVELNLSYMPEKESDFRKEAIKTIVLHTGLTPANVYKQGRESKDYTIPFCEHNSAVRLIFRFRNITINCDFCHECKA